MSWPWLMSAEKEDGAASPPTRTVKNLLPLEQTQNTTGWSRTALEPAAKLFSASLEEIWNSPWSGAG
jgi:hypothetical protein